MPDHDRDTATEQFLQHHDVVERPASAGGTRILTRLEQLLSGDHIRPVESEAGRRFARDWLLGVEDRGRSSLDLTVRGNGSDIMDMRADAFGRWDQARAYLDRTCSPAACRCRPPHLLVVALCCHDFSFNRIAGMLGIAPGGARAIAPYVGAALRALAEHYQMVDILEGRRRTERTRKGALARFEPETEARLRRSA